MLSKVTSFLNAVLVSNHRVMGKVIKDVEYLKTFSSHCSHCFHLTSACSSFWNTIFFVKKRKME